MGWLVIVNSLVEHNAELARQRFPVFGFQLRLRPGQFRTQRIMDQVQRQSRSIAGGVELLERGNAFFKNAIAPLRVHVVRGITGKRSDDLHLVRREIFRQPAMGVGFDDGKVVAVHDLAVAVAGRLDEAAEVFAQLRRAAGEVNHCGPMSANPLPHPLRHRRGHHFRAPRRGIHVTMSAGLVASAAQVDLQRLQPGAAQGQPVAGKFLLKRIHAKIAGEV